MLSVLSHEIVESMSDPIQTGWFNSATGEENGDT